MRRLLVLLLLVATIACAHPIPPVVAPAPARPFDGIASIEGDGRVFCTAFAVAENTWATAAHCAIFALQLKGQGVFVTIDGTYAEVIAVDGIWDLATMHSKYSGPVLGLSDQAPVVGDVVVIKGFPYGMGPAATQGHVAALNVPIEGYHMSNILDITVAGGNSGSPVLLNGKVIGILWGGFNESPHSLAVPYEATVRFLRDFVL